MPRRSCELARKDVSNCSRFSTKKNNKQPKARKLRLLPVLKTGKVLELLPPGSFVTLDNQPNDLPPFQVIHCKGGRCWVRQQAWGRYIHWEVEHRLLKSA